MDGVAAAKKPGAAPKPPQRKAMVKPKPVEVINISPDTQEVDDAKAKKENPVEKKKDGGEGTSKKKAHAFSSVLTARSKVRFSIPLSNSLKFRVLFWFLF